MNEDEAKPNLKPLFDALYVGGFIVAVVLGSLLINAFIFRSFSVVGPSMEPTLHTGERLIVNKMPQTFSVLSHKEYMPTRGEVVVFKNPLFQAGRDDEFVVKRVMGLPGERVVVEDGVLSIYNREHPGGFQPDKEFPGAKSPTTGSVDRVVPKGQVFVAGDNRIGSFSLDSRNGMNTIPVSELQGPVSLRLYPFDRMRLF